MKTYNTIKTTTPGTALETIPGLEVPALPEKIAKIDQAGSNEFQMKLGSSFLKFREALILALRDPMSLGLGGGEATTGATSVIPISWIVESSALKVMTNLERNKLAGIENGAQVNRVTSVQGRVGGVVVSAADLGLGNVDNTSDVNKPVSTAQATAINARIPKLGYVGVSMNGASLTADIGKMYGVYATGVTITLPSATTVGDGEVIGFMIGVNAGRTLQINTTSSQNLITPEGVKTTGYAVTGFARTIYAVCYFHTWMLCGMEDSAIAAATSNMMTVNTAQNVTGVKTFKTPFITSPDGTANYSAFSIGANPGGLTWYLQFKPLTKELNWYTVKGGLSPVPFRLVYDPDPRAVFPISPKVPDLPAGDSSDKATNSLFVTSALSTKLDRWSYHYTVASTITGVPWRLQGFGASSTMTLPLASSVEDGTQIGALIVTGGGTVTLQRSGTDQFVTPSGLATSYTLAGNGSSIVLVRVSSSAWACLGAPDSMINAAIAPLAPLASPALTGTPTAPTAAPGTNSTQLANTAFVQTAADTLQHRWTYQYQSGGGVITGEPWKIHGFGASGTLNLPLASTVPDGTQIAAMLVPAGDTRVKITVDAGDQFITPVGMRQNYTFRATTTSFVCVKVTSNTWAALGAQELIKDGTPNSPTANGTKGATRFDANYFYVCIATNTWVRFAKDGSWT